MSAFSRSSTGISVTQHFSCLIDGKIILITGPSTNSIGAETAISLAHASPSIILLAGRSEAKISPVIKEIHTLNPSITTHFIPLDLASQKSIRKAAFLINSLVGKIDILINNAGVMAVPTYQTTEDGIELQFGCNHIGHFLLTNLVLEKLLKAGRGGRARIINVSSTGYELGGVQFDDWNFNVYTLPSPKFPCMRINHKSRKEKTTTLGKHMHNPKRRMCYSPALWPQD